jgi:hypothetical protein
MTGLLLAYQAFQTCPRERDIGERDIGERDIGERDFGVRDFGVRDMGCEPSGRRISGRLSPPADPHPYPRYFRLPQLLAELASPGEVFVASQAPNAPAH